MGGNEWRQFGHRRQLHVVGATRRYQIAIDGFRQMNAGVLNGLFLVGQADGLPHRLCKRTAAQTAGVGHDLLHQNPLLFVGKIIRHAGLRLLDRPALDRIEILQRDPCRVIDESPPLATGPKERTKPALVIADVQIAAGGQ